MDGFFFEVVTGRGEAGLPKVSSGRDEFHVVQKKANSERVSSRFN